MATYNFRGRDYQIGSWTDWEPERGAGQLFDPSLQCKFMRDDRGWIHNLLATGDEPKPDDNHVHIKFRQSKSGIQAELVACSIVSNGEREHSRREMIENINRVASLSIPWR